jgi:hypothetical protein
MIERRIPTRRSNTKSYIRAPQARRRATGNGLPMPGQMSRDGHVVLRRRACRHRLVTDARAVVLEANADPGYCLVRVACERAYPAVGGRGDKVHGFSARGVTRIRPGGSGR